MKRIHMIVVGDVQGVGFRAWAKRQAVDLAIGGWVKNREDRTVEIVGVGEEADLLEFAARCRKGPEVAWVERVETTWEEGSGDVVSFEVLY